MVSDRHLLLVVAGSFVYAYTVIRSCQLVQRIVEDCVWGFVLVPAKLRG